MNKDPNILKYTETFYSAQGEGQYTGRTSAWIRFFMCNLECRGFGQPDPTNPETYKPVGNDINLIDINDITELPVFEFGCDSAYSVSRRFRHLITERTVEQAADELTALLPGGSFQHPLTKQWVHLCLTGGEPMLKPTQRGIDQLVREFVRRGNTPKYITVETNGTQPLIPEMEDLINDFYLSYEYGGLVSDSIGDTEWFWSISPKLWSTAGEKHNKAIRPEVVGKYAQLSPHGQLKYVVNGSEESWREVEENTRLFRDAGCDFPVWIMPEGATEETQMGVGRTVTAGDIAHEALARGYNISARMHVYLWGNVIGV